MEVAIIQDSVKWILLKTRHFLTKACKGIQYSGKLYTATMKPLPLKWIPSQVPLKKMPNFNNNLNYSTFFSWLLFIFSFLHAVRWLFESVIFYWKSASRIYVVSYWKMESQEIVCGDASLCGVLVMLVVKFYWEW